MTTVYLYQDAGFGGDPLVLNAQDNNLHDHLVQWFNPFWTWEDSVSSIKVIADPGVQGPQYATFYQDRNLSGDHVTLQPGEYSYVGNFGIANDSISSVKVTPNPPQGPGPSNPIVHQVN